VQSIDKAVSFTGTALSSAARVEAWRVLAGESPEYVQLALGEDLLLEEAELFGACDRVILRRLLDDGVVLLPSSAQIQRSELPLGIDASLQTRASLLTYSMPEGSLVPSAARSLRGSGLQPDHPLRGVFPFHERTALERLPGIGEIDGERTLLPEGFEGQALVLSAERHAARLVAAPAMDQSPRLVLLTGGVGVSVSGVVPGAAALEAMGNSSARGTAAPVYLELGSRGEAFGPRWKLPEGPFRFELLGLEPDAYSASLTLGPAGTPTAKGAVLASAQTELLLAGALVELQLLPEAAVAGEASASLTLVLEDPHELVPPAFAHSLELTLDRVDLPPERGRLKPSRRLRLALADPVAGQARSFSSHPAP
jgi:hypothetical protein